MLRPMPGQEILPFPPTPSASRAGRTMQESSYQNRVRPRRLPEDAPNILIVLIDDAGPGLPDTFGGEKADARLVVLPPPCPQAIPPIDFSHPDLLVERGYENACEFLDSGGADRPPIRMRMQAA
jgi:hypothetical protein